MISCATDNEGNVYHYKNEILHKDDGPAVEYFDGSKYWYKNGLCHREDGPAVEYINGDKFWFYNGKEVKCFSTEELIKILKLKAFW